MTRYAGDQHRSQPKRLVTQTVALSDLESPLPARSVPRQILTRVHGTTLSRSQKTAHINVVGAERNFLHSPNSNDFCGFFIEKSRLNCRPNRFFQDFAKRFSRASLRVTMTHDELEDLARACGIKSTCQGCLGKRSAPINFDWVTNKCSRRQWPNAQVWSGHLL